MTEETQTSSDEAHHKFSIQRIYTKDISFETPNTPEIFQTEWRPQVDINLKTDHKKLSDTIYEVVLQLTVTAKLQDKMAFLVEIKQAGIFMLKEFTDEQLGSMFGSFCPNILFPYARELISETISRGSFPPLYLAPINFDAFYQEQLKQKNN
ncbi:MAG: protein-export chaperone SecB [Coxiellaceae bacterium]|jgi:preprotein translocase subunit SecB|nr:protein-export chaperone SecB [Coxiellaceae bacterium]